MKRMLGVCLLFIFTITLGGCGLLKGTPFEAFGDRFDQIIAQPSSLVFKPKPDEALKEFMAAMKNKDYTGAVSYLTDGGKMITPLDKLQDMRITSGIVVTKVIYKDNDKNSDQVVIRYTYNTEDHQAGLKKLNGAWKIEYFGPREY